MGQFSIELLDPQLNDNMLGFLNVLSARNFWRKNFSQEQILRAGIGSRKSQKKFCLTKISRHMAIIVTLPMFPPTASPLLHS